MPWAGEVQRSASLTKNVKSAFAWSAIEQAGQQATRFVLGIILARLLSPAEFGLVGMLAVFLGIASVFTKAGLAAALVQRKEITDDDTTSCFWLNIAAGVLLVGVLCLVSPLVAWFYETPVLAPMLCVLSLQVVFGSVRIVPDALRSRDMDFRTLALVNWTSTIASGIVGVVMAWQGLGVWSLVTQSVLRALLYTVVLWGMRPWRPRGKFRWSCICALWPFSSRLFGAGMLDAVFQNLASVAIGKMYSAADLGLYTRALGFSDLPSQNLTAIAGRVSFPYFSRMQDDKALLKMRLRQLLRLTATLHFPIMIGIAVSAPALVPALVTAKWTPCVPLLQVLSLASLAWPLHVYHLQAINALGRSDLFLRLEVIKKLLAVICLVVTVPLGVFAMTCGSLASSFICYWINSFYTRRLLGYSWRQQLGDLIPILTAGIVVGAAGIAVTFLPFRNPWSVLALQGGCMAVIYVSLLAGFRRILIIDAGVIATCLPWWPRSLLARTCVIRNGRSSAKR